MTDIIDRLRSIDCSWSDEGEIAAAAADEIERLRAAFEVESALREHWGKQWEEQCAENERLRAEVSELQTEMDGEIQAAKMHIDAYLEAHERLRAERDRALDKIAAMAAELDTPYAWHHLHHGLRYERGDGDGWWPLHMIVKPGE